MVCVNCGCDPTIVDKGRMINRAAWLGSQVIALRERIPQLEKLARKTPPKTLLTEWEKVKQAKVHLEAARKQLSESEAEWTTLKATLGWR